MIEKRIADFLLIEYEKRILIFDFDKFNQIFNYPRFLSSKGFEVIFYKDVEELRFKYETDIKNSDSKYAIIVQVDIYVPYDIRRRFYEIEINLKNLFPKLNANIVSKYIKDIDLISYAYDDLYIDYESEEESERFLREVVFTKNNIENYCKILLNNILSDKDPLNITYKEWIDIAKLKSRVDYYNTLINGNIDTSFINHEFEKFVINNYQKLSQESDKEFPVILPKVLDFITKDKTALIVLDGMSLFDFEIISRSLQIEYEYNCSYALIPTTTSISRQSLLSGKYPRELSNPFNLKDEEKNFYIALNERGFDKDNILYHKGYDPDLSYSTKFLAIVINDIDDLVHNQTQGRLGMYNDLKLWIKSGKLINLLHDLFKRGYEIYITSDHGNTPCVGVGLLRNMGVEVETRSKRMLVLKDFGDIKDTFSDKVISYPGYYLDKTYKYYICKSGISFDNKNEEVITHGGITIDEVIVPFIKVKAVE